MEEQILMTSTTLTQLADVLKKEIMEGVKEEIENLNLQKEPQQQQDELLTISQACNYLKCSKSTFFRILKKKSVKKQKRGRNTLVRMSELERYLATQDS